jgi:hypothetical protein
MLESAKAAIPPAPLDALLVDPLDEAEATLDEVEVTLDEVEATLDDAVDPFDEVEASLDDAAAPPDPAVGPLLEHAATTTKPTIKTIQTEVLLIRRF